MSVKYCLFSKKWVSTRYWILFRSSGVTRQTLTANTLNIYLHLYYTVRGQNSGTWKTSKNTLVSRRLHISFLETCFGGAIEYILSAWNIKWLAAKWVIRDYFYWISQSIILEKPLHVPNIDSECDAKCLDVLFREDFSLSKGRTYQSTEWL